MLYTMKSISVLRIVLSAPSDVSEQKHALHEAAREANQVLLEREIPFHYVVTDWEIDVAPGRHALGAQAHIDETLRIPECDLLIAIFSRRFGTPTGNFGSGTEEEISQALQSWDEKGSPEPVIYFDTSSFTPTSPEEELQMQKLEDYKTQLHSMPNSPLVGKYEGAKRFRAVVVKDLITIAKDLA